MEPKRYSIQSSPFLNEVRKTMRLLDMSSKTKASRLHHIVEFIKFHGKDILDDWAVLYASKSGM